MRRSGAAAGVAAYYTFLFGAIGFHLPFWPLWLADRGMNPAEIGILAAVAYASRIAVNPVVGTIVDRRGDRRRPIVVLAFAAALVWTLFAFASGFSAIFAITVVASGLWAGMMPIGDSLAMMATGKWNLDYGRMRLWGSAAFIVSATLGGRLLLHVPVSLLVWPIALALGATALAASFLPDLKAPSAGGRTEPIGPLLTNRVFLLFAGFGAANQAAHTLYYAFASLYWRSAGIADDTIGLLWSEGVLAEIALFAASGLVVRRLGPVRLLMVSAIAGILRWTLLATTTHLPLLVVAQLLHAATFGAAHLGAMHFLQRAIPPGLSVRAQGLHAAIALGLAPALISPLTGWLYQQAGGLAFFAMAAISSLAALFAWRLGGCWRGGPVIG